jgi:hypothetical protein
MPDGKTKYWCLKSQNHFASVPIWVADASRKQEMVEPEPKVSLLDTAIALAIQTGVTYITWNYGVVAALAVAQRIGLLQALALVIFINFLKMGKAK